MRKIRFRAWNKEQKVFITWDYLKSFFRGPYDDFFENEKYVLQQYTGLKDKNGKEIYEGDIVRDFGKTWVIKFGEIDTNLGPRIKMLGFYMETSDSDTYHNSEKHPLYELLTLEIIGNIYENPELLKGEDSDLSSCCNAKVEQDKCLDCGDNCITNEEETKT